MAKTLNRNVTVRDPSTMQSTVLRKGEEPPEWAADMLGDHLFGDVPEDAFPKPGAKTGDTRRPSSGASADVDEDEGEGDEYPDAEPSTDWKVSELQAYARAHGIGTYGAGNSKEKILAKIREAEGQAYEDPEG